jgi:ferrous iron transport protein B
MSVQSLHSRRIVIAGQPNTGKSTVFTALTGLYQAVGNWAGKTVEKRAGRAPEDQGGYTVIDLPGAYSLTPEGIGSEDERIAVDFLRSETPDLTVVVASACSPERTLSYALDAMLLGNPMLIVLNMADVAKRNGLSLDPDVLGKHLGVPVVVLSATMNSGREALRLAVRQTAGSTPPPCFPVSELKKYLPDELQAEMTRVNSLLLQQGHPGSMNEVTVWKAFEGEKDSQEAVRTLCESNGEQCPPFDAATKLLLKQARFSWLEHCCGSTSKDYLNRKNSTRSTDRWFLHPVWGTLSMATILLLAIITGFLLGFPPALMIGQWFKWLEPSVSGLVPASLPLAASLTTGAWKGLGAVLSMLPFIVIFYAVFALLEDVGYMARAAFLMDRFMRRIGLNGRTFVPLLFSLPCNIAGVIGLRTVDDPRQRFLALLLIPLVPCAAKIIVLVTLASWFFRPGHAILVIMALLSMNAALLGLCSVIFSRFVPSSEALPGLLLELPHYHSPNIRTIWRQVYRSIIAFIKKAATLIVSFTVLIWVLSHYPGGTIETSFLGRFGQFIQPIGTWMGMDWRLLTSLLASSVSKEAVMATMSVVYNAGPGDLPTVLRTNISQGGAIAFMCAQSLFIPCIATIGMMFSETKSWKVIGFLMGYTAFLAFVMGILAFQVTRLF